MKWALRMQGYGVYSMHFQMPRMLMGLILYGSGTFITLARCIPKHEIFSGLELETGFLNHGDLNLPIRGVPHS
jgi:hypothetical protein